MAKTPIEEIQTLVLECYPPGIKGKRTVKIPRNLLRKFWRQTGGFSVRTVEPVDLKTDLPEPDEEVRKWQIGNLDLIFSKVGDYWNGRIFLKRNGCVCCYLKYTYFDGGSILINSFALKGTKTTWKEAI